MLFDLICLQHQNQERAIFGKGPYRIFPRFKALEISESKWATLTHQQQMSMHKKFKIAGMDSAMSLVDELFAEQELRSTLKLSIAPENSGIKIVSLPVLQITFEKAKCLLQKKGLVVPKPGATDGSYIAAGSANNVYTVTTGKVNMGVLSKFLKWFTSSKFGPSFSSFLVTDKQNVGRKGSKRKIGNMAKPPMAQVCDIKTSPDGDVLASPHNLPAIKKTKAKKKVAEKTFSLLGSHNEKESRQSPRHLLNEFNSFSVQDGNGFMENSERISSALYTSVSISPFLKVSSC